MTTTPTYWPTLEIDAIDMERTAKQLIDELGAERTHELAHAIAALLATPPVARFASAYVDISVVHRCDECGSIRSHTLDDDWRDCDSCDEA